MVGVPRSYPWNTTLSSASLWKMRDLASLYTNDKRSSIDSRVALPGDAGVLVEEPAWGSAW
ncbi:MAG: hypothetical protein CM1200mP26_22580 [Acidimicrobiales bacterium]|nr:MAG: hypothetical protein CM1200mP26_22580 [Acidimicrobiales bacterium]